MRGRSFPHKLIHCIFFPPVDSRPLFLFSFHLLKERQVIISFLFTSLKKGYTFFSFHFFEEKSRTLHSFLFQSLARSTGQTGSRRSKSEGPVSSRWDPKSPASLLGHRVNWSLCHFVTLSFCNFVTWSHGHLVTWSLGHLVTWSPFLYSPGQ